MRLSTRAVRTRAIEPSFDPFSVLPRDGLLWAKGEDALVGWGEAARVEVGEGDDRFARAAAILAELFAGMDVDDPLEAPGSGPVAFGSFTFDERDASSVLVVPRVVVARRGRRSWVTTVGDEDPDLRAHTRPPEGKIRYAGTSVSEPEWLDSVSEARARIERGDLDKVVLARDVHVWSKSELSPPRHAERLARRFPDCFTFVCEGLVGASPELLARRIGLEVSSVVLAGSAPRGRDPASDADLGRALLGSDKDRREHELAVASARDPLKDVCTRLEVEADATLLRLANVQHLRTRIHGELGEPLTALDVAGRLHPTAAVGGTPRAPALEAIRSLEAFARGRYAGPVGWVDARGDGEWGIALRCGEFEGDRGRLFAGAGIVRGSVPEAELEETRLKLRAMQSVLGEPA